MCIKISLIKTQYSMENFQNEFQTIEYNADKSLVTQIWKKNSEKLERESFEKEMLELAKFFTELKPKKVLLDMREFFFVVGLKEQAWINENVNSILAEIKSKSAYIVSPDLFTAVSVEQTLAEDKGQEMPHKFFQNEDEAREWLFE